MLSVAIRLSLKHLNYPHDFVQNLTHTWSLSPARVANWQRQACEVTSPQPLVVTTQSRAALFTNDKDTQNVCGQPNLNHLIKNVSFNYHQLKALFAGR